MVRKLASFLALAVPVLGSYAAEVNSVAIGQFKDSALVELKWLASEAPEHGAIIFQAVESKAFVQFSGRELSLDLPQGILSERQLGNATSLLLPRGVETFSYPVGGGPSQTLQHSFCKNYEGDSLDAWDVVQLIFRKVFELDEGAMISVTRIE